MGGGGEGRGVEGRISLAVFRCVSSCASLTVFRFARSQRTSSLREPRQLQRPESREGLFGMIQGIVGILAGWSLGGSPKDSPKRSLQNVVRGS